MIDRATKMTLAVALAAALVLSACSSGVTRTATDEDGAAAAPQSPAGGAATRAPAGPVTGSGKGSLLVTLDGGAYPGRYEVRDADIACLAVRSPSSFTAAYAAEGAADPAKFDGLLGLQFESKTYAAGPETKEFRFGIQVSKPGQPMSALLIDSQHVQTEARTGSGTAAVEIKGAAATLRVKGQTRNGVKIEARIDCADLARY